MGKFKDRIFKYIKYNDKLNPALWDGDELKLDVRVRLLEIGMEFYKFLKLEDLAVYDVIFVGSNCNYNYNDTPPKSDCDLHLIVDYSQFFKNETIAENFFGTKKTLWSKTHNIKLRGYDVELYAQNINTMPNSEGIYSVKDGKWIAEPSYDPPKIDDIAVVAKTKDYVIRIKEALKGNDPQELEKLIEKLYDMRKSGMGEGRPEYSVENLTFKAIRNLNLLSKLRDKINAIKDHDFSLYEDMWEN
jgi:hypothetical protein